MLTLYHSPQSRSTRMLWLLEEAGVPYRVRQVSIFRPMTGEGEGDPANPHPDQRVPALTDGSETVAESVAIVQYLTDAYPDAGLGPSVGAPGRGAFVTWLAWYAAEMEPAMFAAMSGELDANPLKKRNYDAVVARIEGALAVAPYLTGDEFTGVDLLVGSAILFARAAFPSSPAIDAYAERCAARPARQRSIELDDVAGVVEPA
jgi:glutathione S-transferase